MKYFQGYIHKEKEEKFSWLASLSFIVQLFILFASLIFIAS